MVIDSAACRPSNMRVGRTDSSGGVKTAAEGALDSAAARAFEACKGVLFLRYHFGPVSSRPNANRVVRQVRASVPTGVIDATAVSSRKREGHGRRCTLSHLPMNLSAS